VYEWFDRIELSTDIETLKRECSETGWLSFEHGPAQGTGVWSSADWRATAPDPLATPRAIGRRAPSRPAVFRCRALVWVSRVGRARTPRFGLG